MPGGLNRGHKDDCPMRRSAQMLAHQTPDQRNQRFAVQHERAVAGSPSELVSAPERRHPHLPHGSVWTDHKTRRRRGFEDNVEHTILQIDVEPGRLGKRCEAAFNLLDGQVHEQPELLVGQLIAHTTMIRNSVRQIPTSAGKVRPTAEVGSVRGVQVLECRHLLELEAMMRTVGAVTLVALLVLAGAACGGKKEVGQSAGTGGSTEDVAKSLQQFSQQMQQVQKGPDGKPYEPVDFNQLKALLPDLPGWEKGNSTGETMAAPFAHSLAKADYTKGDASIEIEITDSAFSQLALMPFQMMLGAKFSKETDTGYEKSTSVSGQPALEKWDKGSRSGELSIIAANRFIVAITGNGIDSASVLHDVAGKLDIGKLAGMK
jgi:hypothetical protein